MSMPKSILKKSGAPARVKKTLSFDESVKVIGETTFIPLLAPAEMKEPEKTSGSHRTGTMRIKGPAALNGARTSINDLYGGGGATTAELNQQQKSTPSYGAARQAAKAAEPDPIVRPGVILEGSLKVLKETGVKGTWIKRFVVLTRTELSIHKDAFTLESIKTYTVSSDCYVKEISKRAGVMDCTNSLEVFFPRANVVLKGASQREATEWITAICSTIDSLGGGEDSDDDMIFVEEGDEFEDDFVETPVAPKSSVPVTTPVAVTISAPVIPVAAAAPAPVITPVAASVAPVSASKPVTVTPVASAPAVSTPVVTVSKSEPVSSKPVSTVEDDDDEFEWYDEDDDHATHAKTTFTAVTHSPLPPAKTHHTISDPAPQAPISAAKPPSSLGNNATSVTPAKPQHLSVASAAPSRATTQPKPRATGFYTGVTQTNSAPKTGTTPTPQPSTNRATPTPTPSTPSTATSGAKSSATPNRGASGVTQGNVSNLLKMWEKK